MTEYEGAALFLDYLNTSIQLVLAYISILSAFLIMSYFAADKLINGLMGIVIILFTLVCVMLIFQLNLTRSDMAELYAYLTQFSDTSLEWFGTNPSWAVRTLTYMHYLVTIGGYIGCLVFFFWRRSNETSE
jgi:hypothetical protein